MDNLNTFSTNSVTTTVSEPIKSNKKIPWGMVHTVFTAILLLAIVSTNNLLNQTMANFQKQNEDLKNSITNLENLSREKELETAKSIQTLSEKISLLSGGVDETKEAVVQTQGSVSNLSKDLTALENKPELVVTQLVPGSLPKNYAKVGKSTLAVKGQAFAKGIKVDVYSTEGELPAMATVEFISSTDLKITLPEWLKSGYYDLLFVNPDGTQYQKKGAFLITSQEI